MGNLQVEGYMLTCGWRNGVDSMDLGFQSTGSLLEGKGSVSTMMAINETERGQQSVQWEVKRNSRHF